MGQGLVGRETQGLNIQQLGQRMQLKNFACACVRPCACVCVCIRPRVSVSVHVHLRASTCVCAQKIKRPDVSFVQGLCTIFACLLVCLLACLLIYLSIYLSIYLFIYFMFLQLKADHSAYYRDALRYLGCVDITNIPSKCIHVLAHYFIHFVAQ